MLILSQILFNMATSAEVGTTKDEVLVPAPPPIQSAWKTPLIKKLSQDTSKDVKEHVKNEAATTLRQHDEAKASVALSDEKDCSSNGGIEENITPPAHIEKSLDTKHQSSCTDEKNCQKDTDDDEIEAKPKVEKINFVEAPPPKTNPWIKKSAQHSLSTVKNLGSCAIIDLWFALIFN